VGVLVYLICLFIALCLLQLPGDKKKGIRSNEELENYNSVQVYLNNQRVFSVWRGRIERDGRIYWQQSS
jgi:hypothetical protein